MTPEQLKKTYVSMKAWLTKHKRDAGFKELASNILEKDVLFLWKST
jgi:hypothetical protein